ncbi:hypothetical protein T4E_3076 [Trichinella pseudospiralis]|uniref:Uncharacterized protein n=1 Tax=Trichinella pseudospiralis TaxID=6337 RepID=A0A0V0XL63_TRIPS|nr:hypothetical protein T4E_3076 [Trichinella pseudospiralis]
MIRLAIKITVYQFVPEDQGEAGIGEWSKANRPCVLGRSSLNALVCDSERNNTNGTAVVHLTLITACKHAIMDALRCRRKRSTMTLLEGATWTSAYLDDTWLWQTMNGYGFYLAMPAGRCIIWNVKLVHSGKENFVSPESSAEKLSEFHLAPTIFGLIIDTVSMIVERILNLQPKFAYFPK